MRGETLATHRTRRATTSGLFFVSLVAPIIGLVTAGVAAPVQKVPSVGVQLNVVGAPPPNAEASQYRVFITCKRSDGSTVGQRTVDLVAGASQTFTAAEFPGLSDADRCRATATAAGAQTTYSTTQPDRSDGSSPDPVGGSIENGTFGSAPAIANGQAITVTHRYVGDLAITKVVNGAPANSMGTYQLQVTCSDSGFAQSVALANGQTRLISGIPVGSTCLVTEPSTPNARFEDNSGNPGDGSVVIVATPASCWDLRNTDPACRVSVVSTHTYGPGDRQLDAALNNIPDDAAATTTVPGTETTAVKAATTAAPAAPAPVEEPAMLDAAEETVDGDDIAFTGSGLRLAALGVSLLMLGMCLLVLVRGTETKRGH